MRICLCTDTYLPEINGVTTVLAIMRDRLVRRGHDVLVIAPRYGSEPPELVRTALHDSVNTPSGAAVAEDSSPPVIRLASIPCPGYRQVHLSWPWGRGLPGLIEKFRPNVVHAVTEGPLGSFGRGFARRRKLPLVTSFHTDFPRYANEYLGPWAVGPTRRWLLRFHRAAAMTMTPSAVTRLELLRMGIPAPVLWGRGVDTAWFHSRLRSTERREARGGDHRVHVLHVGRLAVEKDVDTLIQAYQMAHAELGDDAVFCVAGDGPRAAQVRSALPFAHHYGFLNRGEVAELYADADLFVFPSPTETCGLVVLEALASRVPVIGAKAGGVPENVLSGLTGMLVAPRQPRQFANAIISLSRDPDQRYAMGEAARAFALCRDWNLEIDALEALYESVAQISTAEMAPSSWPTTTSVA